MIEKMNEYVDTKSLFNIFVPTASTESQRQTLATPLRDTTNEQPPRTDGNINLQHGNTVHDVMHFIYYSVGQ